MRVSHGMIGASANVISDDTVDVNLPPGTMSAGCTACEISRIRNFMSLLRTEYTARVKP